MFISKKELDGLRDFVNKALDGAANAQSRLTKAEAKLNKFPEFSDVTATIDSWWDRLIKVENELKTLPDLHLMVEVIASLRERIVALETKKTKKKK